MMHLLLGGSMGPVLKGVVLIMFQRIIAVTIICFMPVLFTGCASSGSTSNVAGPEPMAAEKQSMASEFTLGVGDTIEIVVYRHDDMKLTTKINPSGTIMFPMVGDIQAAGKSLTVFRQELTNRLSKYIPDPQVSISISSVQSQKILVLGEVKSPGAFALDTDLTILDAVGKAGGWTADAKTTNVLLLRNVSGKVDTRSFDVTEALQSGSLSQNLRLQRNDIIFIPTKKIADIARFMGYISNILSPIVMTEGGIVLWPQMLDALKGESSGSIAIPTH